MEVVDVSSGLRVSLLWCQCLLFLNSPENADLKAKCYNTCEVNFHIKIDMKAKPIPSKEIVKIELSRSHDFFKQCVVEYEVATKLYLKYQ